MKKMKAVGYLESKTIDQHDALLDIQLPIPTATDRDLLVKVSAISVNPVDTKIRMRAQPSAGEYKVLGWDAVGEVSAIGENVSGFKVGDKVWYAGDITRAGANSEYHLVDERIVGKQPASLSNMQAAALPLTAITAWELLFDRLGFEHNPQAEKSATVRLLIIGAAGGVGSILSQLALTLTNATVIGTASRKESKEWLKGLALDYVIDHSKPLSQELAGIGIEDVTHVISLTHTDSHYAEIVKVLAPQGQLALIDDPKIPLDIMQLKLKSISVHWELMFTKSMFKTADMHSQGELLDAVSAMVDQGKIETTLGEHYGLINADNLKKAHALIESGKAIGKVVLAGF